ncbi:MAG: fluoride efflux transporter FluC [Planctomycetota bacterium]|jgi:CrcB protein
MLQLVWIAVAGALGALCRWGISRAGYAVFGAGFAWGTLIANTGLNTEKIPEALRTALAIGFLGALTTFSTFSYETISYVEDGAWMLAILNIGTHLIIGLGATVGGLFLARTLFGATAS